MTPLAITRNADGSARYTTQDGDMVDQIAWRLSGRDWGITEPIYDANPGLAALGPILSSGVTLTLPAPPPEAATRRDTIRLFD